MRFLYLIFAFLFIVTSCSSVKRTQKYTAKGQYDKAIDLAVKKLQQNRNSKNAAAHIEIIEEAFSKAVKEDLRNISRFKKENTRSGIKNIYYTYLNLEERQNKIRPLLPLQHHKSGKTAKIFLTDYDDQIIDAKKNYTHSLYEEAREYMNRQNKQEYRNAHLVLSELQDITPNYKDVHQLLQEAHFEGTDFILVSLNNHSGKIIPGRLQNELLDFNTYKLDDFWTEYHASRNRSINYAYGIDFNFQTIEISPERITEKEYNREKQIQDEEIRRDRAGNIMRDSLGNPIKSIRYKDVKAKIQITTQEKSVLVGGTVIYFDLHNNKQINNFPLGAEFIFKNIYAEYTGEKEALGDDDLILIKKNFVPFPSNEQMVLDAGSTIKEELKRILKRNKFN